MRNGPKYSKYMLFQSQKCLIVIYAKAKHKILV